MSAWPARLRDLRDCKSARLRHSSRPPTLAATPRLRCINICRTPVVDWIGFQRLIPNPVRTAVRRNTRPQTVPSRERRNTKVLRLSPISRTVGHTSIPVFSSARIRFRCSISGSVHGNRRPCRRTQSPLIQKRRNPAVPRPRPASRQTGHGSEAEPNPISRSNLRTSPRQRRLRQTIAARTQPEPAESRGSSIKIGRPCSKAHTDSSVPLVPNPISMSDSRISPRKQAVRQRTQTAPIRKRRNTKAL